MVCRRTFPSKLKALKTNVICYMAKEEYCKPNLNRCRTK